MDQGHEEGLINLLARVSRDRQVIVMTHARRFAQQVEAQFAAVGSFTKYVFERGTGPEPQIALAEGRLETADPHPMIFYAVVDDALSPDFPLGVVKRQVRKLASRILGHLQGATLDRSPEPDVSVGLGGHRTYVPTREAASTSTHCTRTHAGVG